jgi:predicted PhzF superfamily epimerase YddE/YHI9
MTSSSFVIRHTSHSNNIAIDLTMAARKLIEKVTARVFCQLEGGGNPVTIFSSQSPLKPSTQARLAQECEWESVCVSTTGGGSEKHKHSKLPSMAVYMPTGEQVSFCAHAAMGGALQLAQKPEQPLQFTAAMSMQTDNDSTCSPYTAIVHEHEIVSLEMEADFTETVVPHRPTLHRIIRDCFGLESSDLTTTAAAGPVPVATFCNSSIARPKTLVYVNSLEALHRAKAPAPSTAKAFTISCDAVESTGIYLYAPVAEDEPDSDNNANANTTTKNNSWECRQFPRASGYPEDPATGIAAAALAVSMYSRGNKLPAYKFYQGTAMGQPSLIMVENVNMNADNNQVSFRLLGRVEVDQRDQLEVDDE